MAYEPTTWKSGDVVTSAKLNKLEKGVEDAGGVFVVGFSDEEEYVLDKTWTEIRDAMIQKKICIVYSEYESDGIMTAGYTIITATNVAKNELLEITGYTVETVSGDQYVAESADGYPTYQD